MLQTKRTNDIEMKRNVYVDVEGKYETKRMKNKAGKTNKQTN